MQNSERKQRTENNDDMDFQLEKLEIENNRDFSLMLTIQTFLFTVSYLVTGKTNFSTSLYLLCNSQNWLFFCFRCLHLQTVQTRHFAMIEGTCASWRHQSTWLQLSLSWRHNEVVEISVVTLCGRSLFRSLFSWR